MLRMSSARTYSISELEKLSGFNRRTITYYLQQGLIPRAGRRGPKTRYPEIVLLRLRFIRGMQELQDQGRCGTVTLKEIGILLDQLEPQRMAVLVERGVPIEQIAPLLAATGAADDSGNPPAGIDTPPVMATSAAGALATPGVRGPSGARRSYGLADAGIRQRLETEDTRPVLQQETARTDGGQTSASQPANDTATVLPQPDAASDQRLGALLRELELRPAMSGRRLPPGASEQWTQIPITSRVYLSVRGLPAKDTPLADAAARELKRILRSR